MGWSSQPLDLDGWITDFVLTFPAVQYSNGDGETALLDHGRGLQRGYPPEELAKIAAGD